MSSILPPRPPLPARALCRVPTGRHAVPCHPRHGRDETLSVGAVHVIVGRPMPEPSHELFPGRHVAPDVTVEYALAA